MTNLGNPQQEIKYQWTQQSKDAYNKLERNLLRLLTKIVGQQDSIDTNLNDGASVATHQSVLKQLTPCEIDGFSDIPFDKLSAHQWNGNFPEEVSVEFFKDQDKLKIVYCGSNDPKLNEYFKRFDFGETLSVFISFNPDGNPWLFTITSRTFCLHIRIEDNNFIEKFLIKLQNYAIVFAQQVPITKYKQGKSFEKFYEEKSDFVEDILANKLDDVSPMFEGIDQLSIFLLNELIACPYYRPRLPNQNQNSYFDDKNAVTLMLSRAFETNFLVRSIEKLEQAKQLEISDKISYQQLVDTCFYSTETWKEEDNKTINVEFSPNEEFSITFAKPTNDVFDDWLDDTEYYCFNPAKSNQHNYFVIGNWTNKKILILEDELEDIDDNVIDYFSSQDLNFVVNYGQLPTVFTQLQLSEGYVINKDIYKNFTSESPFTKIKYYQSYEGNSSVTLILRMAHFVYLMMKTFNEQNSNNTEQKQKLNISPHDEDGKGPRGDGNGPRGDGKRPRGDGKGPRGDGKRPCGRRNGPRGGGNGPRGGGNGPRGGGNGPRGGGNGPRGGGNAPRGGGNAPRGGGNAPRGGGNGPRGGGNGHRGGGNQ